MVIMRSFIAAVFTVTSVLVPQYSWGNTLTTTIQVSAKAADEAAALLPQISFKTLPRSAELPLGGQLIKIAGTNGFKESFVVIKNNPIKKLANFSPIQEVKKLTMGQKMKNKANAAAMALWSIARQFPQEAASFFVAMGAVEVFKTLSERQQGFSTNPMADQQLLDSQTSFLGQFSFFAFMAANRATVAGLGHIPYIKSMHRFKNYIGMSAGMTASNTMHSIANMPAFADKDGNGNLFELCLKEAAAEEKLSQKMLDQAVAKKEKSYCDLAWKAWAVDGAAHSLQDWAPGLASMLAASAVAAGLQVGIGTAVSGVYTMASWGSKALSKIPLVAAAKLGRAATLLSPTTWVPWGMEAANVALKQYVLLQQNSLFLFSDQLITQPYFLNLGHNILDGQDLAEVDKQILDSLVKAKSEKWEVQFPTQCLTVKNNPNLTGLNDADQNPRKKCEDDLDTYLIKLSELMEVWRQKTLQNVLMAHSNWAAQVNKIMNPYNASKYTYMDYISTMNNSLYKNNKENQSRNNLNRNYPLNGITPTGIDNDPSFLVRFPDDVEEAQLKTVSDLANMMREGLLMCRKYKDKSSLSSELQSVLKQVSELKETDDEETAQSIITTAQRLQICEVTFDFSKKNKEAVEDMIQKFKSNDRNQVGLKIEDMRKELKNFYLPVIDNGDLARFYQEILNSLGEPRPIWAAGYGYNYYFGKVTRPDLDAVRWFDRFAKIGGNDWKGGSVSVSINNSAEAVMMSALTGPDLDKGEDLISWKFGGYVFTPPKLIRDGKIEPDPRNPKYPRLHGRDNKGNWTVTMYTMPVKFHVKKDGEPARFDNIWDVLRQPLALKPVLLSRDEKAFENWWEQNVDPQVEKAFSKFTKSYQEITARLIMATWGPYLSENKSKLSWQTEFIDSATETTNMFNSGPVSNYVIPALRQERKLYLLIMGELLKDISTEPLEASDKEYGPQIRETELTNLKQYNHIDQLRSNYNDFSLLSRMHGDVLDFSNILFNDIEDLNQQPQLLKFIPLDLQTGKASVAKANLKAQDDILSLFTDMENVLREIKVRELVNTQNGEIKIATVSTVSKEKVEETYKRAKKYLDDLKKQWGIEELRAPNQNEEPSAPPKVMSFKLRVLESVVNGLQRNLHNLRETAVIANAVSYKERLTSGLLDSSECSDTSAVSKGMSNIFNKNAECSGHAVKGN